MERGNFFDTSGGMKRVGFLITIVRRHEHGAWKAGGERVVWKPRARLGEREKERKRKREKKREKEKKSERKRVNMWESRPRRERCQLFGAKKFLFRGKGTFLFVDRGASFNQYEVRHDQAGNSWATTFRLRHEQSRNDYDDRAG